MDKLNREHFPALDGLRGVAIVFVMLFHSPLLWFQGGFIGVDIFFVLSGFLITSLLADEYRTRKDISFKNFYVRRVLRLMPAMLLLLSVLWMSVLAFGTRFKTDPHVMAITTFYTLLYSANWGILYAKAWPSVALHFWSLAIEEQFYLIWPVSLFIMLKSGLRVGTILKFGTALIIVLEAWSGFVFVSTHHAFARNYFATDTRINSMLIGCATCFFMGARIWRERLERIANAITVVSFMILASFLLFVNNASSFVYLGGLELAALATACLIVGLSCSRNNIIYAFLSNSIMRWVGKISYGLYLWNGVIVSVLEKLKYAHKGNAFYSFVLGLVLSFVAATLSYYLLEKRFLKMKKHFNAGVTVSRTSTPLATAN